MSVVEAIKPVAVILIAIFLAPIILGQFFELASQAQNSFNQTITVGDASYSLGGVMAIILSVSGVLIILYFIERGVR